MGSYVKFLRLEEGPVLLSMQPDDRVAPACGHRFHRGLDDSRDAHEVERRVDSCAGGDLADLRNLIGLPGTVKEIWLQGVEPLTIFRGVTAPGEKALHI